MYSLQIPVVFSFVVVVFYFVLLFYALIENFSFVAQWVEVTIKEQKKKIYKKIVAFENTKICSVRFAIYHEWCNKLTELANH